MPAGRRRSPARSGAGVEAGGYVPAGDEFDGASRATAPLEAERRPAEEPRGDSAERDPAVTGGRGRGYFGARL